MPHFVVFGITYIICLAGISVSLPAFALRQTCRSEQVVNNLAVILSFVHTVGQWIVANQFVDDSLKHDVEVLHQQVFPPVGAYIHLLALLEEGIAEIPQLQSLVGEILVFDLVQTRFPVAIQIGLEAFARDELVLAAYLFGEAISFSYICAP